MDAAGPRTGPPGQLLGELVRLSTAISEVLAGELGVSLRDLAALHHLVGQAPRGPAELARELGITTASATVLVDRLERAGCLRRRRDPEDRRRLVLEATPEMASRSLRAVEPLTRDVAAIDEGLRPDQRALLAGYLGDVIDAMRRFLAEHHHVSGRQTAREPRRAAAEVLPHA